MPWLLGPKCFSDKKSSASRSTGTEVLVTARTAGGTYRTPSTRSSRAGACRATGSPNSPETDPNPHHAVPWRVLRVEAGAARPRQRAGVSSADPRYPFLGVHITPRVDGEVLVGPNAVWHWRARVTPGDGVVHDVAEIARTPAFWRFARQHWQTGIREMYGSLSKRRFIAAARAYVPEISDDDVVPGTAGIRAQALEQPTARWSTTSGSASRPHRIVAMHRRRPRHPRSRLHSTSSP